MKTKEHQGLTVSGEDSSLEGSEARECRNSGDKTEFKNSETYGMCDWSPQILAADENYKLGDRHVVSWCCLGAGRR